MSQGTKTNAPNRGNGLGRSGHKTSGRDDMCELLNTKARGAFTCCAGCGKPFTAARKCRGIVPYAYMPNSSKPLGLRFNLQMCRACLFKASSDGFKALPRMQQLMTELESIHFFAPAEASR